MLFLEDLYSSKRTVGPDWRSSNGQSPQIPQRDPPPTPHYEGSQLSSVPVERHERLVSTKRNSIFSRRKSTATTNSTESQLRISGSGISTSNRSHSADMTGGDSEGIKSKLFGFHGGSLYYGKRAGSRKSDPSAEDAVALNEKHASHRGHHRTASADSKDQSSSSLSRFERQLMDFNENGLSKKAKQPRASQITTIISPPEELQSSLAKRPQKRPPPLRPKRPDDSQIPQELLSPGMGMHPLRQIRSAETFNAPFVPQAPISPGLISPKTNTPLPPRRPYRRASPYTMDQPLPTFRESQSQVSPMAVESGPNSEWDRLLPLYNPRPGNFREAHVMPQMQPMMAREPAPFSIPQHSPLFSPPLEQVPEEPEGFNSPRHSKEIRNNLTLRHAKSSPNMSRSNSTNKLLNLVAEDVKVPEIPKAKAERPMSQGSDTLGDLSRRSFLIKVEDDGTTQRPKSQDTDGSGRSSRSWENDIEFCYKHAAEADCQFDWNDVSKYLDADSDDELETRLSVASGSLQLKKQWSGFSDGSDESENLHGRSFFHQSIIVGMEGLPELDYQSVHTGSSNSLNVITPHGVMPAEPFRPMKGKDSLKFTSPALPPIDLRRITDSDQIYEELMVGFSLKEAQQQHLPILEPKAYSPTVPQQQISPPLLHNTYPVYRTRAYSNERMRNQLPPPPTSAPTSASPPPPLAASLSKDLPPLPPASPAPLRMDNLVAQLRDPDMSPIDAPYDPYTPPPSTKASPVPDTYPTRPLVRRQATRKSASRIVKVQDLDLQRLSRNSSEDTVMTTIFIPSTPPDSPDTSVLMEPLLPTSEQTKEHVRSLSADQKYHHSSAPMPIPLQDGKRSTSDSALHSPPKSPGPTSPTGKSNYSLFPQFATR